MRGWTASEQAAFVSEYFFLPYGAKKRFLAEKGVKYSQLRAWRATYFFGDLERGLLPRETPRMGNEDVAEFKRLRAALERERAGRAEDQRRHAEDRRRDAEEIERLQRSNEALGKAIGLLHELNGQQEPTGEH